MLVYQRVPPKFMGIHQLNSFLASAPGSWILHWPEVPARWHVFEADGFGAMTTFWRWTCGEISPVNKLGWWSWVCPNLGDSPSFYGHFKKEQGEGVLHQETSGEARLISFSWWFCDSKRAKYFDLYLIHPLTSCNCVPGSQKWQSHVRRHQGVCGVPGSSPARAPDQRGMLENLWETSG